VLGNQTLSVSNGSTNFNGVISGAGGLSITGGTQGLTGTNSYTGTTNITSGSTLAVSGTGSIATSVRVVDAGNLNIAGSTTGGISIMTLTGAGSTTLGGNTLTLTNASDTYAGAIGGTGGLAIIGGTETLTGSSTYTGGTTVTNASVTINNAAALGAASGALTLNTGTLVAGASFTDSRRVTLNGTDLFDTGSNTLGLSGVISGAGTLVKQGAGTLTLSGANTYSGGTTVNVGTLAGTTTSLQGNILNNAAVIFNQNSNGTYAGVLTGTGTTSMLGSGTLTLAGNSPADAGTFVAGAGTTVLPGTTLGGAVRVSSGATFTGTGTVGGLLTNSGTLQPTPTVGVLNLGSFTQTSAGTLITNVSPSTYSGLQVAGRSSLAGTFTAVAANGTYPTNGLYPFLTSAGGVTGTFTTFNISGGNAPLQVIYGPNQVSLQVVYFATHGAPGSYTSNVVAGQTSGETNNQSNAGAALNSGYAGGSTAFQTASNVLANLPSGQIPGALTTVGGNINAVPGQTTAAGLGQLGNVLLSRGLSVATGAAVADASGNVDLSRSPLASLANGGADAGNDDSTLPAGAPRKTYQVWLKGFGGIGNVSTSASVAAGYNTSFGGGAIGFDTKLSSGAVIGAAVGGLSGHTEQSNGGGTSDTTSTLLGVYGVLPVSNIVLVDASLSGSIDQYTTSRTSTITGLPYTARSSHGGSSFAGDLGVSKPYDLGVATVTPRVGLTYTSVGQDSFTETGAGAMSLKVSPGTTEQLQSHIGAAVSKTIAMGTRPVQVSANLGWRHEFEKDYSVTSNRFVGSPATVFSQQSTYIGKDAAEFGVGASVPLTPVDTSTFAWSAFANYAGAATSKSTTNGFELGVKLGW
jgi:autotransporter-associated beta strand protein